MKEIYLMLLFIITSAFFVSCAEKDNPLVNNTEYIVFTNAYFSGESTNDAVLVTDKDKIESLEKIYENSLIDPCKCGYDYQIHFFDKENNLLYTRIINSESDEYSYDNAEIKSAIKDLVSDITKNPSHFIYNLQINKELKSDSIVGLLKEDGLKLFMLGNSREQYPQVKLIYCEPYTDSRNLTDAEERFEEIIQKMPFKTQSIDSSYINRSTTYQTKYVDFKTNKISRLYYFQANTDLNSIIKQVYDLQVENLFAESCSPYYFIQLLSKEDLGSIRRKMKRYTFIDNVTESNNGFVYQECSLSD